MGANPTSAAPAASTAASSAWMIPAGMSLAGGISSAFEQYQSGKAQSSYYNYLSDTAKINEGLSSSEALSQREEIGAEENQKQIALTNRVNETVGAQKAAMVSGVGASSRSAQDIIGDTLNKGDLDEMALRLNADMAGKNAEISARAGAMNYGAQASGYQIAGINARGISTANQTSSLLGSAGSVANSWYMGQLYAGRGYGGQGNIGSVQ